jgi:uncharacterized protein Yka (UPF0111/DUF47 family)
MKMSKVIKELIEINIYEESEGIKYYLLSRRDVDAIIEAVENLESQVLTRKEMLETAELIKQIEEQIDQVIK